MISILIKRQWKRARKIIKCALSILGGLVTIAEAVNEIFGYQGLFQLYREKVLIIIIIVIAVSIIKKFDNLEFNKKIKGYSDVSITLKVCNALENEGAIIIPTNSTFDTTMVDDFISEKSLQGQYQSRYFKNALLELDQLIEQGLTDKQYVKINDGRKTKTKRYPIGTVSKVSGDNVKKRAYFLVDSDININGIPEEIDVSEVTKALVCLWDSLNGIGNMETYSIPLIGTGRAKVKNASRDEVIKEIVISFLAASRERKITENLIICVHPADFEKIHWDRLCKFIEYQCTFANINNRSSVVIGNQEETPDKVTLGLEKMNPDFDFDDMDDETEESNRKSLKCCSELGTTDFLTQQDELVSRREYKMLSILTGNQLGIHDIAQAMGLPMESTCCVLKRLVKKGSVQKMGDGVNCRYSANDIDGGRDVEKW